MNEWRRWLVAASVVLIGGGMALAVACGGNGNNDNNPTATEAATGGSPTAMETPSGTGTPQAMASPGTMAPNEVHVAETEFKMAPEEGAALPSPAAGEIKFEVHNNGTVAHSFYIVKTDLDEGSLPMSGQTVDENGTGVKFVKEIENIDAGKIADLSATLDAGKYVLICNIAGHYSQGMHTSFTVM